MVKKRIAILGSTGSIGAQTLKIIQDYPKAFDLELISCNTNKKVFLQQCLFFKPKHAVINTKSGYDYLKTNLSGSGISVYFGNNELVNLMSLQSIDLVVIAIVGSAALLPTISAIKNGKKIALANKESLVVAGKIIMSLKKKY